MSKDMFKAPKLKKPQLKRDPEVWSPSRKRKIKNRFLNFCDIVLEYTQYDHMKHEELRTHNTSPLDSGGSTAESFTSDSMSYNTEEDNCRPMSSASFLPASSDHGQTKSGIGEEDDSWESITCFCRKPFSGRPMIECSKCLTWIHLSCAKIRRTNIPDEFTCQKCREERRNKRKSNRMRFEKLTQSAVPTSSSTPPVVAAMS